MDKIPKFNKRRVSKKAIGLEKNTKLINVGPMFVPDYRVGRQMTPWDIGESKATGT